MRQFGLVSTTRWADALLRRLKTYIDARTIAPDAPGFIRTPAGLVPITSATSNSATDYPFQMLGKKTGALRQVEFRPGTLTATAMDAAYDGTPTVGGTAISAVDGDNNHPRLDVTGSDMRAWYGTTWDGVADGAGPGAVLIDAALVSSEITLRAAGDIPTEVAPTIDAATGAADVTGEFYLQIGIVQTRGEDGLYLFNDSVRASHRIIFCPPDSFRPYPIT